ncbi:hypothetical protein LCGC14_2857960 [marine sediment metagenome]|uniref:Uncharacterized protein n=1 Tax=marine sediment metagenome TaxID=412755 RepID=A0A0F8YTB0_9ZZZZ|nr:hypothetical protein [bacterium]
MHSITLKSHGYAITTEFEDPTDILTIVKFENTRIESLKERDIEIMSDIRVWDAKRGITVRKE